LSGVKGKIGNNEVPKEAVSLITGIEMEGGLDQISFEIKALQTKFYVPLTGLNPIELASV
jgi:hypothetical protein